MVSENTIFLDIPEETVKFERMAGLGVITLNRPKVLNALSMEMIRIINRHVGHVEKNQDIRALCFETADPRAFCSGGDIKQAYYSGLQARRGDISSEVAEVFFEEEYALNLRIANLDKPVISIAEGVCMGGGYGLAGNGSHIVATQTTQFAMPEVKIGFFTDVGSARILADLPNHYGFYLGLTGKTIGPADMVEAGIAHAFVPAARLSRLRPALVDATRQGGGDEDTLESCLFQFDDRDEAGPGLLKPNAKKIKQCFSASSVTDILSRLEALGEDEWAVQTLAKIRAACPISVMVTFRHLCEAKGRDARFTLERDFALAQKFLQSPHFYEGVRATLIDKDKNPIWQPDRLEALEDQDIEWYFS